MAGGCVETTSDPVRPPDVPNKANERSDSSGRPRAQSPSLAITMRTLFGRTTSRRLRFQARPTSHSVRIFRSVEREILRRTVGATGMRAITMRTLFGRTTSRRLRSRARGTSRSVWIYRLGETHNFRRTVAATGMRALPACSCSVAATGVSGACRSSPLFVRSEPCLLRR
jgi:hypothetical protein